MRIDDGTKLMLFDALRVQDTYNGKHLLCGGEDELILSDNGAMDEFNSSWLFYISGNSSTERGLSNFSVSKSQRSLALTKSTY